MKKFILLAIVATLFVTACAQKAPDNSYQRQQQQSDKAHKELGGQSK